jgi:chromosome segregation ATPase
VNPALDARLKELDEEIRKLNEGEREVKSDFNRIKDSLQAKGDELGAAKLERSAIAQRIEKYKKDRYERNTRVRMRSPAWSAHPCRLPHDAVTECTP